MATHSISLFEVQCARKLLYMCNIQMRIELQRDCSAANGVLRYVEIYV